jgi:sulfonate transport system ATP-binding protein
MLKLERVSKTYANGTEALRNLSLDVAQGEIVAVLGGSGCGKSTLLRLIAGLDRASEGRIVIDRDEVEGPHPAIGLVFQEPRLLPWLTVAKNIAFGIDRLPKPEQARRVSEALDLIGLGGYGERLPKELSGGQAQRVAIARALVARPKVLLMDEPFSALDPSTRESLHRQTIALWLAYKPTLVCVTHDVAEAVTLADRVVVLAPKPGRISEEVLIVSRRPRERSDDGFATAERRVRAALDASLTKPVVNTEAPALAAGWW